MEERVSAGSGLAASHGFSVQAGEAPVGSVETPVFAGSSIEPDYLVVRTTETIPGTFRVVSAAFVREVDPVGRRMTLGLSRDALTALPESLPIQQRRAPRPKEES